LLAAERAARADAAADLEKARSAYVAHRYEEAEKHLRPLVDGTTEIDNPDTLADARMVLGAVLLAESKKDEANGTFEKLLFDDPDYQPDPLRVSQDAIDALIDVRTRLKERLAAAQADRVKRAAEEKAKALLELQKAAARTALLEKLASEEVVTQRNSRWVALVPFGVGQFMNGQTGLGYTFLVGEGLLGAGSLVGAGLMLYNAGQTQAAVLRRDGTAPGYNARAQESAWAGDIFGGAFVLAAAVGVLHAELTFVPERVTVRKRALPPLSLTPVVGPTWLGLVGTF
jgi:tetratricopeptide (TPR) repeat protein